MLLLLVEDNEPAAAGVMWALHDLGHQVRVLHTGRPVFGMIGHIKPDAVILDISLPDLSGVVVARIVREGYPRLPIVFASGHGNDFEGFQSIAAMPHTAILQKPYEIADLLRTIERLRVVPASGSPH